MGRTDVPNWVRAVACLALVTAPVFASLGVARSKPEWACGGVALAVYGLVVLLQGHRSVVHRSSPADAA